VKKTWTDPCEKPVLKTEKKKKNLGQPLSLYVCGKADLGGDDPCRRLLRVKEGGGKGRGTDLGASNAYLAALRLSSAHFEKRRGESGGCFRDNYDPGKRSRCSVGRNKSSVRDTGGGTVKLGGKGSVLRFKRGQQ